MKILAVAMLCHAVNLAYCEALGDMSQLPWDQAPTWQRSSAIKGVIFILTNPDASPSASHEIWLKEKLAAGWTYGEVKDAEKKTHPCIVDYLDLPVEQRAKDYIFGAIVRTANSIDPVTDLGDYEPEPAGQPSSDLGDAAASVPIPAEDPRPEPPLPDANPDAALEPSIEDLHKD